jgi:hypothetical protein
MAFASVNYLSIVLAAVAAWIFGAAYYSAFGKFWVEAQGRTMETFKQEQAAKSGSLAGLLPFAIAFVAELIIAYVLYGILMHMGQFTIRAGLISGAFCWFGFVLTTVAVNNAFSGRSVKLTAIDGGHWLGALIIIGVIVGWFGP